MFNLRGSQPRMPRPTAPTARTPTHVDQVPGESRQLQARDSQVRKLLAFTETIELFHAPGELAYATVNVSSHRETHRLTGKGFRNWLLRQFYLEYRTAPSDENVQMAIRVCESKALFDGPRKEVFVRIGETLGHIYIDLGDLNWRAVEVNAAGWRVIDDVPVRFHRPIGLLALPEPVHGGNITELRTFLNLSTDDDWVLFVGSLIAALRVTRTPLCHGGSRRTGLGENDNRQNEAQAHRPIEGAGSQYSQLRTRSR